MDVYIYKLDLNVEKPVVEKYPAQIREGAYGDEVIRWIGPNDYSVWHSEFDIKMLGIVYEPLDNVIELIVKRDKKESESIAVIEDYCCKKAASIRKKLDMYHRGIGAILNNLFVRDIVRRIVLNDFASSIPDIATEKTKKSDDGFFEHLYISGLHLNAVDASYNDNGKMACVGLMEECSELIQALSKHICYGTGIDLKHVVEEMAHVIICIRLVCSVYEIEPSDIQKEIMRKYPEGYSK